MTMSSVALLGCSSACSFSSCSLWSWEVHGKGPSSVHIIGMLAGAAFALYPPARSHLKA